MQKAALVAQFEEEQRESQHRYQSALDTRVNTMATRSKQLEKKKNEGVEKAKLEAQERLDQNQRECDEKLQEVEQQLQQCEHDQIEAIQLGESTLEYTRNMAQRNQELQENLEETMDDLDTTTQEKVFQQTQNILLVQENKKLHEDNAELSSDKADLSSDNDRIRKVLYRGEQFCGELYEREKQRALELLKDNAKLRTENLQLLGRNETSRTLRSKIDTLNVMLKQKDMRLEYLEELIKEYQIMGNQISEEMHVLKSTGFGARSV